jgi:hypothetical protein
MGKLEWVPQRFLDCRDGGHSWRLDPYLYIEGSGNQLSRSRRCRGCRTECHDLYNRRTGALISRRYRYPKSYRIKGGTSKSNVRLEVFSRLDQHQEGAA